MSLAYGVEWGLFIHMKAHVIDSEIEKNRSSKKFKIYCTKYQQSA